MLGMDFETGSTLPDADAFVLGTPEELHRLIPQWKRPAGLAPEAFAVSRLDEHGHHLWMIAGGSEKGELYGVFHLLEQVAEQRAIVPDFESPSAPIRWVNQWDNFDGSIERGYAGRSIFFGGGHVRADLTRVSEYGRLLASVGLNGCTVNNVNSDLRTLQPEMLRELARIADALRPWGVRMSLSVDLSSPEVVGHLPTFDPLDPQVAAWWQQKADEIYRLIPDFGGFVVKADSEGRPGPSFRPLLEVTAGQDEHRHAGGHLEVDVRRAVLEFHLRHLTERYPLPARRHDANAGNVLDRTTEWLLIAHGQIVALIADQDLTHRLSADRGFDGILHVADVEPESVSGAAVHDQIHIRLPAHLENTEVGDAGNLRHDVAHLIRLFLEHLQIPAVQLHGDTFISGRHGRFVHFILAILAQQTAKRNVLPRNRLAGRRLMTPRERIAGIAVPTQCRVVEKPGR